MQYTGEQLTALVQTLQREHKEMTALLLRVLTYVSARRPGAALDSDLIAAIRRYTDR